MKETRATARTIANTRSEPDTLTLEDLEHVVAFVFAGLREGADTGLDNAQRITSVIADLAGSAPASIDPADPGNTDRGPNNTESG